MYVCVCIYVYVCMCVHIRVYICMYVCVRGSKYVCEIPVKCAGVVLCGHSGTERDFEEKHER